MFACFQLRPNPNPNLVRFEEPTQGSAPLFQMVPAAEHAADYRQRIVELITTLTELESRHPTEVLNDMLDRNRSPANGPSQAMDGVTSCK